MLAVTVTAQAVVACVYVSTPVQLATTRTKNPAQHANHVYQALTVMKLEKRLVKIVQLGKIQQQVHLIVQSVATQKLIIQNMKKIAI